MTQDICGLCKRPIGRRQVATEMNTGSNQFLFHEECYLHSQTTIYQPVLKNHRIVESTLKR